MVEMTVKLRMRHTGVAIFLSEADPRALVSIPGRACSYSSKTQTPTEGSVGAVS